MKTLVVITGPTAVGKTELTLQLAAHYGVSIINADSRQIYRELRIGTASPTVAQLQQAKHYFVGTKSIADYYSASLYEQDVNALLNQLFTRHDVQLLTGGSMMYIDAVCNGIDDIPTITDATRRQVWDDYHRDGLQPLCDELQRTDPAYFDIVDRQNYRRVMHAIEICRQTGHTYTSFRVRQRKERPFRIVKIALNRDRNELYERINRRVDDMMQQGFLDEARQLYCHRSLNALNTVGYKELFDFIGGKWSLDEAVERIKGNTRRYARKQLTWFRRDPEMHWFHPSQNAEIVHFIDQQLLADTSV